MKKKKIITSLMIVIIVLITIIITNYDNTEHTVLEDRERQIISSSSISMMLETGASTGIYEVSTDTSWPSSGYTFNSTLSKCENGLSLSWDSTNNQVIMTGNVSDRCYVYFDVEILPTLADYIMELYTTDGENNLYYFDGEGSYTNASLEAVDYSYRYAGASDLTNNYVCFGSDSETCETDNLYRIIGVFQNESGDYEVKLIKYDYATSDALGADGVGDYSYTSTVEDEGLESYYLGSLENLDFYYWNYVNYYNAANSATGYYNDWSYSQLNTVNLNTNYYNSLDSKWQNMIATHTWIVGGGPSSSSAGVYATAKVGYSYEIENPSNQLGYTIYDAKIGLMYISDYGFAADPTYWNTTTVYYNKGAYAADWMYMGVYEWAISRSSSTASDAFFVDTTGFVGALNVGYGNAVRPVLYLESSVQISSGSGTQSDPYRLQT